MRMSRSAVLLAAGVVIVSATCYFLLRPPAKPVGGGVAAMLEDFRVRNEASRDVEPDTISGERDRIVAVARSKLADAGIASGHEAKLAEAFADLVTACRQPTADKYIQFYEARGAPLNSTLVEKHRRAWEKTSLMTDGRRVAIDSIVVSTILKTPQTSVSDSHKSQSFRWIRSDRAAERGLSLDAATRVTRLAIRFLEQANGPGSTYTLSIGFVRSPAGEWFPVMHSIEGATERPVYNPTLF